MGTPPSMTNRATRPAAPHTLRNAPLPHRNETPAGALHPVLERVLRRCPLTPNDVARIEQALPPLLEGVSPATLTPVFLTALEHRPATQRAQVRSVLESAPCDEVTWPMECRRILEALLDGLHRLQGQRALGAAVYAVSNRLLGVQGTQALHWARQTQVLVSLLDQDAWRPWLRWLGGLPLPSLREGAWLEPLIAALPVGLRAPLAGMERAHDALGDALALPTSPLRLVLLGTAWMLWRCRPDGPEAPATSAGRRLARLPERLLDLDTAARAARRLFAAPSDAAPGAALPLMLPVATAAAATIWGSPRQGPRAAGMLAGTGWALSSLPPARATPAVVRDGHDAAAVIAALWSAWDATTGNATVDLAERRYLPAATAGHGDGRDAIRAALAALYRQDDFLGRLYLERVPPATLRVRNGTLRGARVQSRAPVQLDPPLDGTADTTADIAWSAATATLLGHLRQAVTDAGGCHDTAGVYLDCALQVHLGAPLPTTHLGAHALAGLIGRLEQQLPETSAVTATQEQAALAWLQGQVQAAKALPVRGLEPVWSSHRPDPRSHLGINLALARRVLHLLSDHPALIARCAALQADPARLVVPLAGNIRAALRASPLEVSVFAVEAPPPELAVLVGMLRGLTAMLRAPVRSSGRLWVPEMLAYYGVPWPGIPRDDVAFDRCLAALAGRQAAISLPSPPQPVVPSPPPREMQQAVADQLWHLFDRRPANASVALQDGAFSAPPAAPVAAAWQDAQQQLQALFEAEPLWRVMRAANVSFHSLRVGPDHVTAGDRVDGRTLHLNVTGVHAAGPALARLQNLTARLGCVRPDAQLPLASVLTWHDVTPLPARTACQATRVSTVGERLRTLHALYVRWSPAAADTSPHHRDTQDLRDLERPFLSLHLDANGHYRPSLGTAAAAVTYAALGPFALLLEHPDVHAALDVIGSVPRLLSVDAAGLLVAHLHNGETHALALRQNHTAAGALTPVLMLLATQATHLGGRVRSDGRVNLAELLSAHGGCGPQDGNGTDALQRCAERIRGELRLGMRPHLVHAQDLLDAAGMRTLRATTAAFLARHAPADTTLLQYLGTPLVDAGCFNWTALHRTRAFLADMAESPRARPLQQALLTALGWQGSANPAMTSPTLRASLTAAALVADLGPPSNREARIVLGYRLHKHANVGRTFAALRADLEAYLCSLGRLPFDLCPMAVTLVLHEEAPELLAPDVPSTLTFGSAIGAVNYVSGVHLAERIRRGLSQQMTFSELVSLSAELCAHPDVPVNVRAMALDTRGLATLDWQYFRAQDASTAGNATHAGRTHAAMEAFDARVARIESAITALLAPLPYRMPRVQAEIQRVFPTFPGMFAGLAWNDTQLRLCNDREWLRYSFPLYELVAAGVLRETPSAWYLCPVPEPTLGRAQDHQQVEALRQADFATMQARFPCLADIDAAFQTAFDDYFTRARQGYGVLIEEALHLRPPDERAAIARGEVELFTVRTFEPDLEAGQETPTDTDPYRGRFGVIYCVGRNHSGGCHQLFPLLGRIEPLRLDGPLRLGGVLENRKVRLRHGGYSTIQVRRGRLENLDWDAFANHRVPVPGRHSKVIIERLSSNVSQAGIATDPERSPFHALVAPVQQDFFWLDPVAFLHEGRGPSSFEAHLRAPPLWLRTVDFIFPFVENLRRLGSTDRNELAMAIFGLYLEGVLTLGPVAGGVAKVVMRPGMKAMPRFVALSNVLGRNALDALNPLAGTLAVARMGIGAAQRGIQGGLRFAWERARHGSLQGTEWHWVMRDGMAVLQDGAAPMQASVRTVQGVHDVLVASHVVRDGAAAVHLFDPATLTPYGPLLQERLDSGAAAGVLFKVGEGLRPPRPSPKKVLKPIKQGTKASQEESGERLGTQALSGIGGAGQRPALP